MLLCASGPWPSYTPELKTFHFLFYWIASSVTARHHLWYGNGNAEANYVFLSSEGQIASKTVASFSTPQIFPSLQTPHGGGRARTVTPAELCPLLPGCIHASAAQQAWTLTNYSNSHTLKAGCVFVKATMSHAPVHLCVYRVHLVRDWAKCQVRLRNLKDGHSSIVNPACL